MGKDLTKAFAKKIASHEQNRTMSKKGYTPVFSANTASKIIIIGQAPGSRAQKSGIPWDDASGEQLRKWLGVDADVFYDARHIALIPMDFYFPGKGKTGDLPPRKGFADRWHPQILSKMKHVKLIILLGKYAQDMYLKDAEKNVTQNVKKYKAHLKKNLLPLPHPSPRNNIWKAKNPWFEKKVVPLLRKRVRSILHSR